MKIFGIDPGSHRTGYGCLESDGSRYRILTCGALIPPPRATFPQKLLSIHSGLGDLLSRWRPECVAIESVFHSRNVRSALILGHARGIALLAATQAGLPVVEYTPAEVKRAVVGYGRAEKHQIQRMVSLLLGLSTPPEPHDAADALAVAICHTHYVESRTPAVSAAMASAAVVSPSSRSMPRTWRQYRPAGRSS